MTTATEGILAKALFDRLPQGARLIQMGRGPQLVEADLLAALDSGHLAGASIDVFSVEPLPREHAFWRHPKIFVTPHTAGETDAPGVPRAVAAALAKIDAGHAPRGLVDRAVGY
jgi:glyoxylate/hydroxypyruvate reductase A